MMNKARKYSIGLTLMMGILIVCLKTFQDKLFSHEAVFNWMVGACLFMWIYEWIAIKIVETKKKTVSPRQSINLFMGLKLGKILLSIFFVMIYALAVKVETMRFVMIFAALYLIFLVFDTIYLVYCEKEAKKMNEFKE